MKMRFYQHGLLIAQFIGLSPVNTLNLLRRHSTTPEILPKDPKDLWIEGQQQTTHGHIEWSTQENT